MSLTLPKPVINYLAAVEAKDAEMLTLCFADDAIVHDEGRDYCGLDAIRSWKQETLAKYQVCDGAARCFGERKDCETSRPANG